MATTLSSPVLDSPTLTQREIEILRLVANGHSGKDVADMLYVSKRTVDFHMANLFRKLRVHNRMHAVRVAMRLGLLGR